MSSLRAEWVRFVTSEHSASRYLHARGASELAAGPLVDEDRLRQFWDALSRREVSPQLLARLHFLCNAAVSRFFAEHLGDILRSISGSTSRTRQISRRGVRGKVDWALTSVLRRSGRADNGTFALTVPFRSEDLPENRLLKLLLRQVTRVVQETEGEIGSGALLSQLENVREAALQGLKSAALRGVTEVLRADAAMLQRSRRSRNWRYSQLLHIYTVFEEVLLLQRWEATYRLMRAGWFAPLSDDDLFELYALVLVLDILENEAGLGAPTEYGLIAKGRDHVAQFRSQGMAATVYFDQAASRFAGTETRYNLTMQDHVGLAGSSRRPDIAVRFDGEGAPPRFLILEVKRSEDGQYQRDSVYKAFGYLYDLQRLWSADESPRVALLFPSGVEFTRLAELVCVSGDRRAAVASVVTSVVEEVRQH